MLLCLHYSVAVGALEVEHKEVDDATVREAEHKEVDDATVREAEHKEVDDATVREAEHKEVDDATVREAEHKEVDDATVREAEHKEVDDATVREAEHKEVDDATVREAEHKEVDDATVREAEHKEVDDATVREAEHKEVDDATVRDGFFDEVAVGSEDLAGDEDVMFDHDSELSDTWSVDLPQEYGDQGAGMSDEQDQPSCSGDSSQVNMPASEDDDGPIPPPTRPPSPALVEEFQELPTLKGMKSKGRIVTFTPSMEPVPAEEWTLPWPREKRTLRSETIPPPEENSSH
ncbi:hypothetical protein ACOMHN_063280 [Nucella lapillus]